VAATACLTNQDVGAFELSTCGDAGCADAAIDPRRARILALIAELTRSGWTGIASSGEVDGGRVTAPCRFRFEPDGSYTAEAEGDAGSAAFTLLFAAARGNHVSGRYTITDWLQGGFYGEFEDPLLGTLNLKSDISYLQLDGDTLSFFRRSLSGDLSFVTTQVVLRRDG
jgi:hypothetical protein